ncbi:hypothetical protein POVCU1_027680 [Plasmodium ovale curtisi]|uniref:Uncharacterized protein n=1 Tax=Plasmodium ovale curtisi TaxID=864141 RepID=A0A1A8WMN4_PLAOA|nr:hypothetical protein POVCU1_027680 [Plasmodium ovale curtisi]
MELNSETKNEVAGFAHNYKRSDPSVLLDLKGHSSSSEEKEKKKKEADPLTRKEGMSGRRISSFFKSVHANSLKKKENTFTLRIDTTISTRVQEEKEPLPSTSKQEEKEPLPTTSKQEETEPLPSTSKQEETEPLPSTSRKSKSGRRTSFFFKGVHANSHKKGAKTHLHVLYSHLNQKQDSTKPLSSTSKEDDVPEPSTSKGGKRIKYNSK